MNRRFIDILRTCLALAAVAVLLASVCLQAAAVSGALGLGSSPVSFDSLAPSAPIAATAPRAEGGPVALATGAASLGAAGVVGALALHGELDTARSVGAASGRFGIRLRI